MDALVFYCSNCKQTFLGRDYKEADRPPCPNCKRRTQSTGITKNVWVEMSKEERQEKLDALTQQEEKEKTRKAYAQSVGVTYEENANHNEETAVDGWYTDIGKKIKGWAKTIFIVEAIMFVVGAIIMLFTAEDGWMIFTAIMTAVVGPIIAWVSSWILYAFGELVDKTAANERNTQNILKLMLENNTKDEAK